MQYDIHIFSPCYHKCYPIILYLLGEKVGVDRIYLQGAIADGEVHPRLQKKKELSRQSLEVAKLKYHG